MRGGALTRFKPHGQMGRGFLRDFSGSSLREGWQGLKKGGPMGLPNIAGGIRGVRAGGKRAIKRKALSEINRAAKRKLDDIFGK